MLSFFCFSELGRKFEGFPNRKFRLLPANCKTHSTSNETSPASIKSNTCRNWGYPSPLILPPFKIKKKQPVLWAALLLHFWVLHDLLRNYHFPDHNTLSVQVQTIHVHSAWQGLPFQGNFLVSGCIQENFCQFPSIHPKNLHLSGC